MATVSGVTADKMDTIKDRRIVDANYSGETLRFTRDYSNWVTVGAFTGDRGPTGSASTGDPQVITDALTPLQPGAWQPFAVDAVYVAQYEPVNYGTLRYRVEQTSIRFSGALQWTAATVPPVVTPYVRNIAPALAAQYRPLYTGISRVTFNNSELWELRYQKTGQLAITFREDQTIANGTVIYLNQTFPLT